MKKIFFENFTSWKKCNLGHYFWFLIDFTHTNNLSQVLLSWFSKKFLCHMYTLCILRQTMISARLNTLYDILLISFFLKLVLIYYKTTKIRQFSHWIGDEEIWNVGCFWDKLKFVFSSGYLDFCYMLYSFTCMIVFVYRSNLVVLSKYF